MSAGDKNTANPPDDVFARVLAQVKDQRYPPVHLWNPDFCGNIDMRIARDGSWYYMGTPIGRPAMVRLFSSVLRHDDDDKYYLVTPVEKLGIRVDDAPLFVISAERHGQGRDQSISFRTLTEDAVVADEEHPIRVVQNSKTAEPSPYVLVRDRLEALIARSVFYDLVSWAEPSAEDPAVLGLWSGGCFFEIGRTDDGQPMKEDAK